MNRSITPLKKTVSLNLDRVGRHSTYPFVPESTTSVHHGEEIFVFLAAEPIQASNFEVTPEMAHVVALAFHGLRVDVLQVVVARVSLQNLVGQFALVFLLRWNFWLLWLLQEHFPQTLGFEIVLAFVSSRIPEDVGDCLSKFLHCNSETVCFIGLGHFEERIAGRTCQKSGRTGSSIR